MFATYVDNGGGRKGVGIFEILLTLVVIEYLDEGIFRNFQVRGGTHVDCVRSLCAITEILRVIHKLR